MTNLCGNYTVKLVAGGWRHDQIDRTFSVCLDLHFDCLQRRVLRVLREKKRIVVDLGFLSETTCIVCT
jgi:hypothetical protein